MCIARLSALAGLISAGIAQADLVVNFNVGHYHRTGLANNGLQGAFADGTPDPNQPNNGLSDDLDLSGRSLGSLTLTPGVPQTALMNNITFIAGITGAGTAGDYPSGGGNGGLDHTSDARGAFITDQTISINGSTPQVIGQSFTVHVGWWYDTVTLHESPVLMFDLGDGNVLSFRALAANPHNSDGSTARGQAMGEFLLTVVPLPPAAWGGMSTLAAVGGIGLIRRRRQQI